MVQPFLITADEVNCLIHSYFQDSGFVHSAFVLHAEGRLDKSSHFGKHVPRGELVELLSKALLYSEVEAHWRGNAMTTNCKTPFSLLERHVCSLDPALPASVHFNPPPPSEIPVLLTNGTNGTAQKRKSSTPISEAPKEKRARTEEMEIDSVTSAEHPPTDGRATARDQSVAGPSVARPSRTPSLNQTPKNAVGLLKGHDCEVYVCAWNPAKRNSLATGAKNAVIKIWSLHDPSGSNSPPESDPPITFDYNTALDSADLTSLDWNQDGTLLAAGSYDAVLRICDASGQLYFTATMHKGPVFATRFSKSGRFLLTASLDGTVCVWDVQQKVVSVQYNCHEKCCLDVEWLSEDTFASAGADAKIQIMRVGTDTPLRTLSPHQSEINQLRCNPTQTRLASCSDDTTARIFDVKAITDPQGPGGQVLVLAGHSHTIGTMAWCPHTADGEHELLVTASFDGTARVWDSVNGQCLAVFSDHLAAIYTATFSPDGQYCATAGGDGDLNVYDVKKRERVWNWHSTSDKSGIFEIDWQSSNGVSRLAMALESGLVGVVDMKRIPALQ